MQTKSNIQLILEETERKNSIYKILSNLLEKYTINDNIFGYKNNMVYEVSSGYFSPIKEGNLKDLVFEMQPNQGIRIIKDKFYLGNLYENATQVEDINNIIEIKHI